MYARPGFSMMPPAIKNLILANIAVFLIQNLWFSNEYYYIFGLVPIVFLQDLFIWQLGTYLFLHGGIGHIFFNMFALWIFGIELEQMWGTKEFIKYYFLTGVIAGITIVLWNFFWGVGINIPTIGASGAVFGILVAFAMFFPDRYIYIWMLFPVKAKYLVLFYGVIELLMLPNQTGISHIGHLGGMVGGFFYLRHRYRRWGVGQNFFRDFFKKKGHF